MLLVTYRCNLNCTYCYEPKMEYKNMTAAEAKAYIQDAVNSLDDSYSEFEIQFMGGEPLLQFNLIKDVSTWLWEQQFRIKLSQIFIVSNGTLLNDEMKSWFSTNRENICIGLSFDGNSSMQDINRSQSSTLVDLQFFVKNWPEQNVKMTISPDTINSLYNGVVCLVEKGFLSITADLAMGDKIEWADQHLDLFAEQLDKLSYFYQEHLSAPLFSMFNIDVLSVLDGKRYGKKQCGCGEDMICIDVDGKQYACHLFSPITLSGEKLLLSHDIDFSKHECFAAATCSNCAIEQLCPHCYGMNFLCTGDIRKQSAFTCKSFKIQFSYALKCQLGRALKSGDGQLYANLINLIENIEL